MHVIEPEAVLAVRSMARLVHLGDAMASPAAEPGDSSSRPLIEERKRISRELHDGVAQELQAIVMHLRLAEMASSAESAASASATALALAERGLAMTRLLLADLHGFATPGSAPAHSLARALHDTLLDTTQFSSIAVSVKADDGARICDLVYSEVIRMVREIATNTLKHANARTITCTARHSKAKALCLIEIRDDGDGFDLPMTPSGCGIRGLYERARRMAGTVSISSERGRGTQVQLVVPILEPQ